MNQQVRRLPVGFAQEFLPCLLRMSRLKHQRLRQRVVPVDQELIPGSASGRGETRLMSDNIAVRTYSGRCCQALTTSASPGHSFIPTDKPGDKFFGPDGTFLCLQPLYACPSGFPNLSPGVSTPSSQLADKVSYLSFLSHIAFTRYGWRPAVCETAGAAKLIRSRGRSTKMQRIRMLWKRSFGLYKRRRGTCEAGKRYTRLGVNQPVVGSSPTRGDFRQSEVSFRPVSGKIASPCLRTYIPLSQSLLRVAIPGPGLVASLPVNRKRPDSIRKT